MFNAERLLGKIVGEVIANAGNQGRGQGSLLDNLAGGSGLLTAIGLGVGAFEILKDQKKETVQPSAPPPPPPGSRPAASPPPPPPPPGATQSGVHPPTTPDDTAQEPDSEELARRMIRVMIAAAHADGELDRDEQQAIVDKLERAGLEAEEKEFLLAELDRPWSVGQLSDGITDPSTARTMYMLAVSTIKIDTEAERHWLDRLAEALNLGREIKDFIEQQHGSF